MDCLGIILAGGHSSRMGENKAFLKFQQQTMLEYCQQRLQSCQLSDIVVSGSNSGGVADLVNNGGPLAGIHSLIEKYKPRSVLVLPIDMPFITHKHLQELKLKGSLANKATHYKNCSLPAFIPVTALLNEFLQTAFNSPQFLQSSKGPSFKQIFTLTQAQSLTIDNQQALFNTNTPEQWLQAKKLFATLPTTIKSRI